jgi:hypothetical protein
VPLVFYTDLEATVGQRFDTQDLCDINREVLEETPPNVQEAEAYLEQVRRAQFPDAPDRMCSISALPWQEWAWEEKTRKLEFTKRRERLPNPPPPPKGARFCYYISAPRGKQGTRHWLVDEVFAWELADRWDEVKDTPEAWRIARQYWQGHMRRFGGASFLVDGIVKVDEICWGLTLPAHEAGEIPWVGEP